MGSEWQFVDGKWQLVEETDQNAGGFIAVNALPPTVGTLWLVAGGVKAIWRKLHRSKKALPPKRPEDP
jgi:hypothetical protein